jgi:hypothetical protein
MFISQKQYMLDILDRAGMSNCKPCSTTMDTHTKLPADGTPVADQYCGSITVPHVHSFRHCICYPAGVLVYAWPTRTSLGCYEANSRVYSRYTGSWLPPLPDLCSGFHCLHRCWLGRMSWHTQIQIGLCCVLGGTISSHSHPSIRLWYPDPAQRRNIELSLTVSLKLAVWASFYKNLGVLFVVLQWSAVITSTLTTSPLILSSISEPSILRSICTLFENESPSVKFASYMFRYIFNKVLMMSVFIESRSSLNLCTASILDCRRVLECNQARCLYM